MKMKSWWKWLLLRVVMTAACLYLVYFEAGVWTVVSLALLFVAVEALQFQLNVRNMKQQKTLNRTLGRLQTQASGSNRPTHRKW